MKTELNENTTWIYLNDHGAGFVLGNGMRIVPQDFVYDFNHIDDEGKLSKSTLNVFSDYEININESKVINSCPVYAHINSEGTLIIETP